MRLSVLLRAALGSALVLAGSSASPASPGGTPYTVMQMNLCLSGFAGCYGMVAYPAGVDDAVTRIRAARPDAITLNEACRGDAARIARRTGYHLRFSAVTIAGKPLRCVRPGRRGRFGIAVLAKAAIDGAETRDFAAQGGPEWRRWLCVATRARVDVCTAHLAMPSPANDAQCVELAAILARHAAARTVVFGGDLNRRRACAPMGAWTRTDGSAGQAPGLQSIFGTSALRMPAAQVVPAGHTDHDVLLVRSVVPQ